MAEDTPTVAEAVNDLTTALGERLAGVFGGANEGANGARAAIERAVGDAAENAEGLVTSVASALTEVDAVGIDEVKPTETGYEILVEDAHGEELVRSLAEMDPRNYDVHLTTDGDARVVELVEGDAATDEANAQADGEADEAATAEQGGAADESATAEQAGASTAPAEADEDADEETADEKTADEKTAGGAASAATGAVDEAATAAGDAAAEAGDKLAEATDEVAAATEDTAAEDVGDEIAAAGDDLAAAAEEVEEAASGLTDDESGEE